MKRYSVLYGLDVNRQWTIDLNDQDDAVAVANAMVTHPHSWPFSFVYDNQAKGEVQLVWSYRNKYNKEYKG